MDAICTQVHVHVERRYLISQHPEVEERILQELAEHQLMPAKDGSLRDMQYEDLGRLTYLNAVIKVLHTDAPHCKLCFLKHELTLQTCCCPSTAGLPITLLACVCIS